MKQHSKLFVNLIFVLASGKFRQLPGISKSLIGLLVILLAVVPGYLGYRRREQRAAVK